MAHSISPYLFYEDVGAALDWLAKAFGFRETTRMPGPEGQIWHVEMELGDGSIMLGYPGQDYENPKHRGGTTVGIHVYVDDVDSHYETAKEAGATIVMEPTDQEYGDRRYDAEDPEGHRWYFAQRLGS